MKKSINVFGLETKIEMIEIDESLNALALFEPSNKRIVLDPRSESLFQDFCHELFHLFWYRTGMRQYVIDPHVEEIIAENFSVLMTENLKDIVAVHDDTKKKKQNRKNIKKR